MNPCRILFLITGLAATCGAQSEVPLTTLGGLPITHIVRVGPGAEFSPDHLSVELGDTVRWEWWGGPHDVVSGAGGVPDGAFSSGPPTSVVGSTFEVTFDQAFLDANPPACDTYSYFSSTGFASGMVGEVVVETPPVAETYGCGLNPPGSLQVLSGEPALGSVVTFGLDNPAGTQGAGSMGLLYFSLAPAPGFPCGGIVPGLGMWDVFGELLVDTGSLLPPLGPAPWSGAGNPIPFAVGVPNECGLLGAELYAQGVLVDSGPQAAYPIGLSEALALRIGRPLFLFCPSTLIDTEATEIDGCTVEVFVKRVENLIGLCKTLVVETRYYCEESFCQVRVQDYRKCGSTDPVSRTECGRSIEVEIQDPDGPGPLVEPGSWGEVSGPDQIEITIEKAEGGGGDD